MSDFLPNNYSIDPKDIKFGFWFLIDTQGVILWDNIAGNTESALMGQNICEFLTLPQSLFSEYGTIDITSIEKHCEQMALKINEDTILLVETNGAKTNNPHIFLLFCKDITQQSAALDDMTHSMFETEELSKQFELALDSVQDGLAIYNEYGKEIFRNTANKRILGTTERFELFANLPSDNLPFTLYALDNTKIAPVNFPISRVLRGEEPDPPTDYIIERADGERCNVLMYAMSIYNSVKDFAGGINIIRDITSEYRERQYNEILMELARACAEMLNEQEIAQKAMQVLTKGLQLPNYSINVTDPFDPFLMHNLAVYFDNGLSQDEMEYIRQTIETIKLSDIKYTLTGETITTGKARFNIDAQPIYVNGALTKQIVPFYSAATLPLKYHDTIFGSITIGNNKPNSFYWDIGRQSLISAMSEEIALALHRARLYEQSQQLAFTDPLTGLANHRSLQENLKKILEEAKKTGGMVSVIMLDIDHFRQFNEKFGHDIGDLALKTVANAIHQSVRSIDHCSRYGGEEFTVILPKTPYDIAQLVAERVRQAIAAATLQIGAEEMHITASLGYASFPQQAKKQEELLKLADLALYESKHNGRNRVTGYTPEIDAAESINRNAA